MGWVMFHVESGNITHNWVQARRRVNPVKAREGIEMDYLHPQHIALSVVTR